jgi:uncharacterized protein (TIGR01777 family)
MKILLFGGTGFVGKKLAEALRNQKHEVVIQDLRRDKSWTSELAKADVIVNLGGAPIFAKRWSYDYKALIYDSRIEASERIAHALDRYLESRPNEKKAFITASAVGFYGNTGDEVLDETGEQATDFLSKVCADWEQAAFRVKCFKQVRRVAMRLGIVLGPDGGALQKMILPFQFFVGGPIGSGKQWTSWVHMNDVVAAFVWAVENQSAQGVYNLTSPNPVRNGEFSKVLAKTLDRPCWLSAPALGLRFAVGEASSVLAGGQRVVPKRLTEAGFQFKFPNVKEALSDVLKTNLGS